MKDWVSIALLFSFLRLQLVCCCGSVGHFDSSNSHEAKPLAVSCAHETEKCCGHSAKVKEASQRSSCDCAVRDTRKSVPVDFSADVRSDDILTAVCTCCGRSSSEHHHHHHLYWLAHGTVVPSSKVTLKNLYELPSLTVTSWGKFSEIYEKCELNQSHSFPPQADLLVMLGHWRI